MSDSVNSLPFGDTIVVANPGTGKTWELVERVKTLLRSGVPGEDIVCVTFTNKAADEMKSRIMKETKSEPEIHTQALNIEISTIHGYAMNYLLGRGVKAEILSNTILRYIAFSKLKELDTFNYGQGYLVEQIVPKIENGIRYLKSFGILPDDIDIGKVTSMVIEGYAGAKHSSMSPEALKRIVRDFVTIFHAYEEFKDKEDFMDYNDLLRVFLSRMDGNQRKIVLVDEFQDLNRMQVDIVGNLAGTRFFVGDRKQSIFGFQGGSLSSFNKYLDSSSFEQIGKKINHRSTNNILNYATSYYLAYSKDKYSREEIEGLANPDKGDGPKVQLVPTGNPESDAVELVRNLLSMKKDKPKSIAIIARFNSQISKISSYLDSLDITYSSTIRNKTNQSQITEILAFVSGLVSDNPETVSRALLTPFAGLTLKEAVEASKSIKENGIQEELLPDRFRELRQLKFGLELVEQAFSKVVLPIAASLGSGYINSANLTLESAREYLKTFENYTLDGYLDFMTLSSEQMESDLRESDVNVLTVHKAKGLEFDAVVYVPSEIPPKLEYFDILTSSIILACTGIDVKQDLLEEPLRVDFVAITRPKDRLYIVAANKLMPRFQLQDQYYEESTVDSSIAGSSNGKFDEAYNMFVNGRFAEAEKLLKEQDMWLVKSVNEYFARVSRLSFTVLNAIHEPYNFLRQYILGIKESSPFAKLGTDFHEIARRYASGNLTKEEVPPDISKDFSNLELAMDTLKTQYMVPPQESELTMELPLSTIFPDRGAPDNIILKGTIDAVFTGLGNSESRLIADYKTSRKVNSAYWQQLWLYTRMYRMKYGIEPEKISGGIIYVGLREPVNTDAHGYEVEVRDYYKIRTDVVERRLQEFLYYKEQPEAFIERILEASPRTEMDSRLRSILEKTF